MTAATALRAQAAAAEDLARRIEVEARSLPDLLDGVAARSGSDVWRGPAADEFGADLRRWRSRLDTEAATLLAVARRLLTRADQLRGEAGRVEAAERAAAAEAAKRAALQRDRAGARA